MPFGHVGKGLLVVEEIRPSLDPGGRYHAERYGVTLQFIVGQHQLSLLFPAQLKLLKLLGAYIAILIIIDSCSLLFVHFIMETGRRSFALLSLLLIDLLAKVLVKMMEILINTT
jgi:hypothetical protein